MDKASRRRFAPPLLVAAAALLVVLVTVSSIVREEHEVLEHTLRLREDQSGFAGVSAKVITIEPDGSWVEEHYLITEPGKSLEHQTRTKHDGGTLAQNDLEELKELLQPTEFKTLEAGKVKEELGSSEGQITISYGSRVISRNISSFEKKPGATIDQLMELAKSIKASISKPVD